MRRSWAPRTPPAPLLQPKVVRRWAWQPLTFCAAAGGRGSALRVRCRSISRAWLGLGLGLGLGLEHARAYAQVRRGDELQVVLQREAEGGHRDLERVELPLPDWSG